MKKDNKFVIGIKHNKKSYSAIIHDGTIVWKLPSFPSKDIVTNKPKFSYDADVADVLFVDKNNNKELFSKNADFNLLKEEGYRPIAIVCVPGNFNIYGDCTVHCIALNYISKNTPEDGTVYETERIDFNTVDSGTFDYGDEFVSGYGVTIQDDLSKNIKGFYDQPILPSDYWSWSGEDNDYVQSNDGVGNYLKLGIGNNSNTDNRSYSPSPYYADQTQQELWWYRTLDDAKITSQSNINGEELTNLYLSKFGDNMDRINVIRYVKEYNPFNSNTKGEWFLGSSGEMGLAATRFGMMNKTITKLKQVFGFNCAAFFQSKSLMTCNTPNDKIDLKLKCIGMKSVVISNESMRTTDFLCKPMIKFNNTTNRVKINLDWEHIYSITLNGRIYYWWNKRNYIEMPIGSILKWEFIIEDGYKTNNPTSGEFIIKEETTIKIENIKEDLQYEIDVNQYSIESWEAIPGDYLFVNGNKLFLVNQNTPLNELKEQGYTPIAIVVTPGSHNVYGDCSVTCAALNWGSKDNDNGTTTYNNTFTFTTSSTINNIPNSLLCVEGPMIIGPQDNTIKGFIERPCLPSTCLSENSTQPLSIDGKSCYNKTKTESNTSLYWYSPSIYLDDDSMNPSWWYAEKNHQTTYQRSFSGKQKTKKIREMGDENTYPAAHTVNNYYPINASCTKGEWFICDAGELAYHVVRLKELNESLQQLINVFGENNICTIDSSKASFILSSIFNNQRFNNIGLSVLLFGNNANTSANCAIRPFIKFNSTTDMVKINLDFSNIDDILINNRHYYSWDNIQNIFVKKGTIIKYNNEDLIINEEITIPNI